MKLSLRLIDLPGRAVRKFTGHKTDYRSLLFDDTKRSLARAPRRILEIGPRDGKDTRRLATLGAEKIVLVDLPDKREGVEAWLPGLKGAPIEMIFANVMYDRIFETMEPFDLVWCTGVLYHNPEQLRFIRHLYDLTAPEGLLVLESATARRARTRRENCVEIFYPPNKAASSAHHLSINVTHLPSQKAVESWLQMVGFTDVTRSDCHRRISYGLAADRVAYLARRPREAAPDGYYHHTGLDYPVGRSR